MKSKDDIQDWLTTYLGKLLDMSPNEIDTSTPFIEYGIDSTAAAGLSGDLGKWLGVKLKGNVAFDHPTIDALTAHLMTKIGQTP